MDNDKDGTPFHMQNNTNDEEEPIYVPHSVSNTNIPLHTKRVDVGSIDSVLGLNYSAYHASGKGLASSARVSDDGRIVISLDLKQKLPELPESYAKNVREYAVDKLTYDSPPKLSIVIMIVGSRGDVQPFLALGKKLIAYGHRVRIATHPTFRAFVKESVPGIEFFSIGGDPAELMSFMVRNPGLIPGFESLTNGDIPRKRKMIAEMLDGCWKSCYEPDEVTGQLFAADAIISNPPAFAHVHCAEALGIPLQLSFTMPWCATTAFPHPLVNISESNAEVGLTNYLSYALSDLMQWQGLGDIINHFRTRTLGLEPLSLRSGASVVDRLRIPWTYCFSPSLITKPNDWVNHIDVVGFYFLESNENYQPPDDLKKFLDGGDVPIYIGFGSVPVEDPRAMTNTIFDAVKRSNIRAIVSAGWGGLGGASVPDSIFVLPGQPGVPHDWLFKHVSAVVHHGGAGTTAIGLFCSKPTLIIPFFGDQPFWGSMVAKAGAGPKSIHPEKLNADNLAAAIQYLMSPKAKEAAEKLGKLVRAEKGIEEGVRSFHAHLPLLNMRCDLAPSHVAVWWSPKYCLKLSSLAAQALANHNLIKIDELEIHRTKEWDTRKKTSDPITGGVGGIFWTITHYYAGIAQIFYNPVQGIINTMSAIPRGIIQIVDSVHEGFQNAPKLYGSEVRQPGDVTDFSSGVKEAGRGFFYGYYDAITGLVTEPIKGAKKEGVLGAIKGSARSFVNVHMRPAAGALGLVTHPVRGAWRSIRQSWAKKQDSQQRSTRKADGEEEIENNPITGIIDDIVEAFQEAMKPGNVEERKIQLRQEVKEFWERGGSLGLEPEHSVSKENLKGTRETNPSKKPPLPPRRNPPVEPVMTEEDDDAAFERDLELAKQLSLEDQRQYEQQVLPTGPSSENR
ncbi:hypothetical protein FRC02_005216 [Tulasnella sp. 418]|nr:hypothetical protein FRC02_005216 [Tulasnella sp. 418]